MVSPDHTRELEYRDGSSPAEPGQEIQITIVIKWNNITEYRFRIDKVGWDFAGRAWIRTVEVKPETFRVSY